jgi:hypothetical protein
MSQGSLALQNYIDSDDGQCLETVDLTSEVGVISYAIFKKAIS